MKLFIFVAFSGCCCCCSFFANVNLSVSMSHGRKASFPLRVIQIRYRQSNEISSVPFFYCSVFFFSYFFSIGDHSRFSDRDSKTYVPIYNGDFQFFALALAELEVWIKFNGKSKRNWHKNYDPVATAQSFIVTNRIFRLTKAYF